MHDPASSAPRPAETTPYGRIAVLGGGAWGTALASVAAAAGRQAILWARRAETAAEINARHQNTAYLGDLPLPETLRATDALETALKGAEAVLIVTPSPTIREIAGRAGALAAASVPFFVCAKGVEAGTGLLMSQIAADAAPGRTIGVISGPTFAAEVVRALPTAVTIACDSAPGTPPANRPAARMALALTTESFRPYVSDDIIGVEVGGAVKNVIAIACGMLQGAGYADNARAAMITRGMTEMKELAEVLGGRRETVTGLSGVGDLILTCSSPQSRNYSFGLALGRAGSLEGALAAETRLVEGLRNAVTVTDLARAKGLAMPISEMVRSVTEDGMPVADAFARYWTAPLEAEPRDLDLTIDHPAARSAGGAW